MARSGKRHREVKKEYRRVSLRKRPLRLFRRVMAMMGKLVLKVNTGNSSRNTCGNSAINIKFI